MADFNKDDFREAVRNIVKGYGSKYNTIAEELINVIISRIEKGEFVSEAVAGALSDTAFFSANKAEITNAMYLAACSGYGVLPSIVTKASQVNIKDKLLSDSWTGDKMNLSTRLHGTNSKMRETIVDTINSSMLNMQSAREMAMKLYDGYNSGNQVIREAKLPQYLDNILQRIDLAGGSGKVSEKLRGEAEALKAAVKNLKMPELRTTYKNFLDAVTAPELNAAVLNKAAWAAVQEKARYHAMRIARTESARAWFDGFIAENQDDEDVWGYRWRLSSRHKFVPFDQCDVCANMNVGYGKGIYPKGKVPFIPRHPHCMCMLEVVFVWEIDKQIKFNPNKAKEYLDSLDVGQQAMLFGYDGVKAYKSGADWQTILRGWDGFNEPVSRLSKADFQLILNNDNGNIKEIREFIRSEAQPKNIDKGNQDKHIEGTNNYKQKVAGLRSKGQYGPSRVDLNLIEIQQLIDTFAGTGEIRTRRSGEWNHKETIYNNDKIVGSVVNNLNGKEVTTSVFKIHYSKRGTHIVPHYPKKEE
ncbi:polymorphic toxin type 50 domain-containing protein [Anaerosinus massiliensis]|uniref:polymorphic toxin type 50 domain-containing protein n=1 Tax=Massilibacillus massiliensis TaxID=1806837 RepID=UPI000DA61768|nr:polymorphic toxin type 50 domain-containing protein [Massilibacillus massiliensis]